MSKLVKLRTDQVVNGGAARTTFAMPTTATPGAASAQTDIRPWRDPDNFNYAPDECMVVLTADKACDSDVALAVYGCIADLSVAVFLASLNNAALIPIGAAASGFAWPLDGVGGFDFLALGGLKANPLVTFSGGALVLARFIPISSRIRSY